MDVAWQKEFTCVQAHTVLGSVSAAEPWQNYSDAPETNELVSFKKKPKTKPNQAKKQNQSTIKPALNFENVAPTVR